MKRWFSEKLSSQSGKKIVTVTEYFLWSLLGLIFLFAGLDLYFLITANYVGVFLVVILYIPIFVTFLQFIFSPYEEIMNLVLLEQINFKKYLDITVELSQKGRSRVIRQESAEVLHINQAYVLYLKGQFKESLEQLEQVDFNKISRRTRETYRELFTYYKIISKIQLQDLDGLDTLISGLKEPNKKQIEAILKLSKGETTDYFDNLKPEWRLEKIVSSYNRGRNYLNQGREEEAKVCFNQIVNEPTDLFVVRNAKKYLEELS